MINEKIVNTLKPIGIPVNYMKTTTAKDKYIIFSIYDEKEVDSFDNNCRSIIYHIQINYWYLEGKDIIIYNWIKSYLKSNGFRFKGCTDMQQGDFYCKSMDFIYKERIYGAVPI